MKNKKVIIAVILGIGAVISLIYGMNAPIKSGKTAPPAIIDNDVAGVGSKIGEYTVVRINKDGVILNDGTGDLELRLAQ